MNARFRGALDKCRHLLLIAATSAPVLALAQTDPFTDAVTEATTKVTAYAGALVGLAAVAVVFMIAVKYVKKIKGAA